MASNLQPRSQRRRGSLIAPTLYALVLLALLGLGAWLAAPSTDVSVRQERAVAIRDFMFSPTSLVVAVGTKVSWKNFDGELHTIRSIDDSFRSGALEHNDSFSHRFNTPGTYRYVCSIHSQMVATIVVK